MLAGASAICRAQDVNVPADAPAANVEAQVEDGASADIAPDLQTTDQAAETIRAESEGEEVKAQTDADAAVNTPAASAEAAAAANADVTRPQPNPANAATPGVQTQTAPNSDQWRFRQFNGRWWYWLPANRWVVWHNNAWIAPNQLPRTYANRSYNGGYSTGYRGPVYNQSTPPGTYYRNGRPYRDPAYYNDGYYQNGYYDNNGGYYPNGSNGYAPGYNDGYGPNGYGPKRYAPGPGYGGANYGNRGANVGSNIGGAVGNAMGGPGGAAIGAGIGAGVGRGR